MIASIALSAVALRADSWRMMWVAALLSLGFSILAGFSIGPYVFLLTVLQFALALAIQRATSTRGWLIALCAGLLVWLVIVPLQLMLDRVVLPWLLAFIAVGSVSTVLLFRGTADSPSISERE
ncbi:MAG: hypothetical protein IT335_02040 [Thermomicrobiales bacterium]|nr:hypothetical protein [Thermomicrobiales bacterium]